MARSKKQKPLGTPDTAKQTKPEETEPRQEQPEPQAETQPAESSPNDSGIPSEAKEALAELDKEGELRINVFTMFVGAMQAGEHGGLLPPHRKELHRKRGLTDETINKARLLSGDPKLVKETIAKCKDKFTTEELGKAGLLTFTPPCKQLPDGGWGISESLTSKNVLIPYLNQQGKVIYLRSHKYGPKGVSIEVFGQDALAFNPTRVVITEGEFKALALQQCGIPAIAIPGISSFGWKHQSRLLDLLTSHRGQEIVILFDNERKDDPSLESYKPDPLNRWDTEYWAIRMARSLYRPDLKIVGTKVARFPDEWRNEAGGKIDPDGALALGKTANDLQKVVDDAVIATVYLQNIPSEEARLVVSWKLSLDRWRNRNPREHLGRYRWEKETEGGPQIETISNFTLESIYTLIRTDNTRERRYNAITPDGVVYPASFSPRQLASNQQFREANLQQGELNWTGSQSHLNELCERLMDTAPPKIVREAESFGHNPDLNYWIFGDGILTANGKILPVGEDGIVWNSLEGLLPLQEPNTPSPEMKIKGAKLDDCGPSPLEIYKALRDAYGSPGVGLVLGWSLACIFSDAIFDRYGFFPLLALIGRKESGKSTLADMVLRQWGFLKGPSSHRIDWRQSTPKGIQRTFAKRRSLPVFIDEYRNDAPASLKSTLRAIFDRAAGVQAEFSNDAKTKTTSIRECGIFAGEEVPDDPALLSRCITPPIDKSLRCAEHFPRCKEMMEQGIGLIRWTILHSEDLKDSVCQSIDHYSKEFIKAVKADNTGARIAEAYAVPFAVWTVLAAKIDGQSARSSIKELQDWICQELPTTQLERAEDDHLERFFQALAILANEPEPGGERRTEGETSRPVSMRINSNHVITGRDRNVLYIHLTGAHSIYEEFEARKKRTPFTLATLRGYLKLSSYARPCNQSRKFGPKRNYSRKPWEVDLDHAQCPDSARVLKEILESQDTVKEESITTFDYLNNYPVKN